MDSNAELTLEAKHAMRTYLLKLVTLPALGIAVLPFLFSYFAKDIAQSKAQFTIGKEANDQLSVIIKELYIKLNDFTGKITEDRLTLYAETQQTLTQTKDLQRKTSEAVEIVDNLSIRAIEIKANLGLQEDFTNSDNLVSDVTNALAGNQPFADLVEKNVSAKIDLPVGTILPSLAPPNIFLEGERAKVWAPADGKQISPDSLYARITNKLKTPDFRGMFLRGLNAYEEGFVRKDGKQDPDGRGRTPGDYQQDALQHHSHATTALALQWNRPGKDLGYTTSGEADTVEARVTGVTDANAAVETRPKNVAVYYYIKIN